MCRNYGLLARASQPSHVSRCGGVAAASDLAVAAKKALPLPSTSLSPLIRPPTAPPPIHVAADTPWANVAAVAGPKIDLVAAAKTRHL